jgi:hypothetical protein
MCLCVRVIVLTTRRAGEGGREAQSNFATVEAGIAVRRRADRDFEGLGPVLCAALDGL